MHLKVLLALAKYKGWIVDKKQVDKRSLSLRAGTGVTKAETYAMLEAQLQQLAPGTQRELKRIAAGEDVIDAEVIEPETESL